MCHERAAGLTAAIPASRTGPATGKGVKQEREVITRESLGGK